MKKITAAGIFVDFKGADLTVKSLVMSSKQDVEQRNERSV